VVNDVHEVAVHVPNRRGADAGSQRLVAPDNRYAFDFQLIGSTVEIVDREDKELVADRAQMLWRFGNKLGTVVTLRSSYCRNSSSVPHPSRSATLAPSIRIRADSAKPKIRSYHSIDRSRSATTTAMHM
jgi:hypothetical protein